MTNRTYEENKQNLLKVVRGEKGSWVPLLVNAGQGTVPYSGMTYVEAMKDEDTFCLAVTKIFDDMAADACIDMSPMSSRKIETLFRGLNQVKIGPDDTSLEHVARSVMTEDDYPSLIANPAAFRKDIIIPRLFPFLFEDGLETAKKTLQEYTDEMNRMTGLGMALSECLREKYNIYNCSASDAFGDVPIDHLFDYYRGFRDTMIDIRRRRDQVKAASEALWETSVDHMDELSAEEEGFIMFCPHMPTYLRPRDFEELYWPHLKHQLDNIARVGRKALYATEGTWINIIDCFRDVAKNTMILMLDDDDPIAIYDKIGDWSTIAGGGKVTEMSFMDKEVCCGKVKAILDHCAAGNFIFTVDKPLGSPSDIKGCVVDVYNFVHNNY